MSISLFFRLGGVDLDTHLAYVKQRPTSSCWGGPVHRKEPRGDRGRTHGMEGLSARDRLLRSSEGSEGAREFHKNRERVVFSVTTTPAL